MTEDNYNVLESDLWTQLMIDVSEESNDVSTTPVGVSTPPVVEAPKWNVAGTLADALADAVAVRGSNPPVIRTKQDSKQDNCKQSSKQSSKQDNCRLDTVKDIKDGKSSGKPRRKSCFAIAKPDPNSPVIGCWGSILFRRSPASAALARATAKTATATTTATATVVNEKEVSKEGWGWECLLVTTPHGQAGFPKGKRTAGETARQTAIRETFEETGLSELNWTLTGAVLTEHRDPPPPPAPATATATPAMTVTTTATSAVIAAMPRRASVGYFVGEVSGDHAKRSLTWNSNELKNVAWVSVPVALQLTSLRSCRKQLLSAALKHLPPLIVS
jgi:8-oxo-dGTP pyrophosphatase MutT (NUDIX family)